MTKEEAQEIVRLVVDAFSTGDCRKLPLVGEIERAAGVLSAIAHSVEPEIEHDSKGLTILNKKLAEYLLALAIAADARERHDFLVKQLPDLNDKLPPLRPRM